MARDKCNPITLFNAIIDRLVSQIPIHESAVLFSIDPTRELVSPGEMTIVVSPLSGRFSDSMMDGGGLEQVTAETGFSVTIRSYEQLDEVNSNEVVSLDPSYGLLQAATKVLQALTIWDPLDSSNNELLRDQLMPSGFEFGWLSRKKQWMTISFATNFDWDLSTTTTTTTTAAP